MPIELTCSGCGNKLRVPDEHAGKQARCPNCQTVQPIPAASQPEVSFPTSPGESPYSDFPTEPAAPPSNPYAAPPAPPAGNANPYASTTFPGVQTRGWTKPHRGGTILTLGIISLCCNPCFILGAMAWSMGSTDLKEIDAGIMDPSGRGQTQAGMILGIVGTVLAAVGMVVNFAIRANN